MGWNAWRCMSRASRTSTTSTSTGAGVRYGDVFKRAEREYSAFNFEHADTDRLFQHFEDAEAECQALLNESWRCRPMTSAIKASHLFNLLDARGVISVTERAAYIGRVRALAKGCCEAWIGEADSPLTCRLPASGLLIDPPDIMPQLLIELFSEDIPARMQARAAEDLQRLITTKLAAAGLEIGSSQAHVHAAPAGAGGRGSGRPHGRCEGRTQRPPRRLARPSGRRLPARRRPHQPGAVRTARHRQGRFLVRRDRKARPRYRRCAARADQ